MKLKLFYTIILISVLASSCFTSPKTNKYYSGFVVDEEGKAIEGVLIREDLSKEYSQKGETDERGYFRFDRSANSLPDLFFEKEGYKTDTARTVDTMHGEVIVYSRFITTDSSQLVLEKIIEQPIDTIVTNKVYTGISERGYECAIQIKDDETVWFVYNEKDNVMYGEHRGRIKQINDSLFYLTLKLELGKSIMKSVNYDEPIYSVAIDKAFAKHENFKKLVFVGSDKKRTVVEQKFEEGENVYITQIVDKRIFNRENGTDFFDIDINWRNPITGKPIIFRTNYYSSAEFFSGYAENINVIIKNNKLKTIDETPLQTGSFELSTK